MEIPRFPSMDSSRPSGRSKHKSHRSQTSLPKITTTRPSDFSDPIAETTTTTSGKRSHRHHHHHHHKSHHAAHSAKDAIQSAIQLHPSGLSDLLKQGSRSNAASQPESRQESRRQSVAGINADSMVETNEQPFRPVRPEDIARERLRAKARQEEIRTTLSSLLQSSLRSTRRLDDTYYSILEHVSSLRSTISSLQDLAHQTRALQTTFQTDTSELESDIRLQIETFSNFDAQTRRVAQLEDRVRKSKEKAQSLDLRLEEASRRVHVFEQREVEEIGRSRRRLRIIWTVLAALAAVLVPLLLAYSFRAEQQGHSDLLEVMARGKSKAVNASLDETREAASADLGKVPPQIKSILNDAQKMSSERNEASASGEGAPPEETRLTKETAKDDPLLHIFEEL